MPGTFENLPHVPENAIVKIVSYYTGKNLNLFLYTLKILTHDLISNLLFSRTFPCRVQ